MRSLGVALLLLAGSAAPALCGSYDDLNAGISARNQGDWDSAIVYLDKAISEGGLTSDQLYIAHLERARALVDKYEPEGAWSDFDAVLKDLGACLELKPGDRTALMNRMHIYIVSGKLDAARQDIDAILAVNPKDIALLYRARIHEVQGDAAKALEDLQAAKNYFPKNGTLLFDIGVMDMELGRPADAAEVFSDLDRGVPYYSWLWLALANLQQGKPVQSHMPYVMKKEKWPRPLIDFFQGNATEMDVITAAGQGDKITVRGQVCETNFYLSKWRSLHGDAAGARPLMKDAASHCPPSFSEWYVAQWEMKNAP